MICKNCKASIPDGSKFCLSCGLKVESEPVGTPASTFSSAFRKAGSLDGSDSGIGAPVAERKPTAPQEDSGLRFSSGFKRAGSASATDPVEDPVAAPKTSKWDNISGGAYSDPKATHTKNRCPHCGGSLDPDAVFCKTCGKKLDESLAEKAERKPAGIKKSNLSKKRIIAIASVALVLVIAASLATLLLFSFGKSLEEHLTGEWTTFIGERGDYAEIIFHEDKTCEINGLTTSASCRGTWSVNGDSFTIIISDSKYSGTYNFEIVRRKKNFITFTGNGGELFSADKNGVYALMSD